MNSFFWVCFMISKLRLLWWYCRRLGMHFILTGIMYQSSWRRWWLVKWKIRPHLLVLWVTLKMLNQCCIFFTKYKKPLILSLKFIVQIIIIIWPKWQGFLRFLVTGDLIEGRCRIQMAWWTVLFNKFRIWQKRPDEKPYRLPGWTKNSFY